MTLETAILNFTLAFVAVRLTLLVFVCLNRTIGSDDIPEYLEVTLALNRL